MLNLTPHAITIRVDGVDHTFPPSGTVARVTTFETVIGTCPTTGAPIVSRVRGEVAGLPQNDEPCIVSSMVADACPGLPGVYAPDTGPTAIRNERGLVVAVTRLVAA